MNPKVRTVEEVAIDAGFDPFTGSIYANSTSAEQFEEQVKIFEVWDQAAAAAYESQGLNLDEIAAQVINNPFKLEDNDPYGRIEARALMNRNNNLLHFFLTVLDLSTDINDNLMNFEPNYLGALMEAHPDALAKAKDNYRQLRSEYGQMGFDTIIDNFIQFRLPGGTK